jgi:hypothetical protein
LSASSLPPNGGMKSSGLTCSRLRLRYMGASPVHGFLR